MHLHALTRLFGILYVVSCVVEGNMSGKSMPAANHRHTLSNAGRWAARPHRLRRISISNSISRSSSSSRSRLRVLPMRSSRRRTRWHSWTSPTSPGSARPRKDPRTVRKRRPPRPQEERRCSRLFLTRAWHAARVLRVTSEMLLKPCLLATVPCGSCCVDGGIRPHVFT
jgi:hypothetical protein